MIYGDRKPNLSALILPDRVYGRLGKKTGKVTPHNLADDDGFRGAISAARPGECRSIGDRAGTLFNNKRALHNRKRNDDTVMKIRRHVIRERYGEAPEALYVR